jgi:O-antigen ligase
MISEKELNKKSKFLINLLYTITTILPFSLITGPFIPDLSITLVGLFFLFLSIRYNLRKYYTSNFSIFFLIFYVVLNFTSFFSVEIIQSFKISFVYFRYFLFSLAVWFLIEVKKDLLKNLLKSISIAMCILIIDGFYQFYFGKNILGWEIIDTRVSSFFKDELILGSYLSRIFPIFFALCILNFKSFFQKKINFFLIFFLLSGIEVLTFLSGERSAFFYINLSAIYLVILMRDFKLLRLFTLCFSFIVIFIITNINSVYKERIVDQTIKQIDSGEHIYIFSEEHTNHYLSGYKMFQDNKITGIGPRMFRANCHLDKYKTSFESCTTHPHNNYIQILTESGLLGIIIFIIPFGFLIYYSIKHFILKFIFKKTFFSDFQLSLMSCFLITLWPLVPTGDFYNNWLNIIYYFPLGIFLASLDKSLKL